MPGRLILEVEPRSVSAHPIFNPPGRAIFSLAVLHVYFPYCERRSHYGKYRTGGAFDTPTQSATIACTGRGVVLPTNMSLFESSLLCNQLYTPKGGFLLPSSNYSFFPKNHDQNFLLKILKCLKSENWEHPKN